MSPRVVSLFSGVGTFDYGFHLAGWKTVFLCEWDAKAREVLNVRFPEVPISPDVRGVRGAELPDAECIMFGSPCQDISVAGKRSGMTEGSDTRSSLFFEAIRIIREKQEATGGKFPRFALWENVPGAFSSNGGRDFAAVLAAMVGGTVHVPAGGWRNAGVVFGPHGQGAWRVLDSQFFRVPQRRRRIFLVADFAGERAGEILLESEGVRGHPQPRRKAGQGITGCLTGGAGSSSAGNPDDNRAQQGFLIPLGGEALDECLTTGTGQRYDAETETLIPMMGTASGLASALTTQQNGQGTGLGSPRGDGSDNLVVHPIAFDCLTSYPQGSLNISPTLLAGTQDDGGRGRVATAFDYKASVQRDPMCGPISPTLEAQDKTAVVVKYGNGQSQRIQVNPTLSPTLGIAGGEAGGGGQKAAGLYAFPPSYAVRRLTPTECERLQSMPDGWTDVNGMADSHRYRFMGNGGTARKLKWIATRMKEAL